MNIVVGGQETRPSLKLYSTGGGSCTVTHCHSSSDAQRSYIVPPAGDPSRRFCTAMSTQPGYYRRQKPILSKIYSLLCSLDPSTYDEVAPKVEFWIEYALAEHSTTIDELVEKVSLSAWRCVSHPSVMRFLKEFRDAPHRSEQVKSFVDELCPHVLWWFAVASAGNLSVAQCYLFCVPRGGGAGFVCAASFVGHLIEWSLLSPDFVRRHLVKPLISHHYGDGDNAQKSVRTMAIVRYRKNLIAPGALRT